MSVDLADVKRLRAKTGAGIGDCKKALLASNNDAAEAEKFLKKQGLASAAKRSERQTGEGKIFTGSRDNRLVMVELLCETDFVAMNEQFLQLGQQLVDEILANGTTSLTPALHDQVQQSSAVLKENLVLASLTEMRWQKSEVISCYSHNQGRISVAVKLSCADEQTAAKQEINNLCHDLALHATAMAPQFLNRDKVGAKFLADQEEIFTALAEKENIAAKIRPNYVKGKLNKLLSELCFAEQNFVKSDKQKIKDVIAQTAREIGAQVELADFCYVKIGQHQQGGK